jgi:hypothetical protein
MRQRIHAMLFPYFFLFAVSSAMASVDLTSATGQLTGFPDFNPNADISIHRSAFGAERVKAACFGNDNKTIATYRILKKFSKKGNDHVFFEISSPQSGNDFDIFMKSWHKCEVMIVGYDESGAMVLATPKAYIGTDRFVRQPKINQNFDLQHRKTSLIRADASQFPLVRIQGLLPVQMPIQSFTQASLPTVSESGDLQTVVDFKQPLKNQTTDILLLTDNSASMKYQAAWFMPKLQSFLKGLSQSGMKYRIGLVPFSSPEQTSAELNSVSVFTEDANQILSDLESKLTFDAPYDDAFNALKQAASSTIWNSSARKIIVLLSNEGVVSVDKEQERDLITNLKKNKFEIVAFLPEQNRFSQALIRRTGGWFYHFNNNDLMPLLSSINPLSSEFSLSYESSELTGQGVRQINLSFSPDTTTKNAASGAVSINYEPPSPFDLMLMPETDALVNESQNRRQLMPISVSVMKQDQEMPDPVVVLHYKDSQAGEFKTISMAKQENDIYTAEIPAEEMAVFAINYYITADTSDYHASLPSENPKDQSFSVAIFPNMLPKYTLPQEPRRLTPGTPFIIEAELFDDTQGVISATLYYRKINDSDYTEVRQNLDALPKFKAEIPSESVTSTGIEYYIAVRDDKNAITYIGSMDEPLRVYAQQQSVFSVKKASAALAVTTGLVAYYPLDGNADDASGNNKHGMIIGGVTGTSDINETPNGACDFNGTDGYIEVNQSVVPTSGDFTVAFWGKGYPNQPCMEGVSQATGDGGSNFYIGRAENIMRVGDDWPRVAEVSFPYNEWHHFSVSKNNNSTWLYIDGILKATLPVGIKNPTGSVFRIGRQYGFWGEWWKGSIDEARIYNRALSGDEIKALATRGGGGRVDGTDFYIWADSLVRDVNNDWLASGNVYIGKVMNVDPPMLRYTGGTIRISSDRKSFRTENNQGTLEAVQVKRRLSGQTAFDAPLYKGNFSRNNSDAPGVLSIQLDVTTESEKILWYDRDGLIQLNSRLTTASTIEMFPEKVIITGGKQDFSLQNPLLSFADFGGVTDGVTNIWSRNEWETTSKRTFGISAIRMGSYDLLNGTVTLDALNWGIEISAGGLAFGAITGAAAGKLLNFDTKSFPEIGNSAAKLNGFTIGAQLNPPAITRLTLNIGIPAEIASQLTIPHVSYSGIPIGIAPKAVGIDVNNLLNPNVLGSLDASITGAVYDNAGVMATIQKVTKLSLLSGQLNGTLDLSGTVALGGNVKMLFLELAKFHAQLSKYAPQFKANGMMNIPFGGMELVTELALDGYYYNNAMGFGGTGALSFVPPWWLKLAMKALNVDCATPDCKISQAQATVSGSVEQDGNTSLKVGSEAFLNYRYPACDCNVLNCWRNSCWTTKNGTYKVWALATLLPTFSGTVGGSNAKFLKSEPGIERQLSYITLETGEQAPVLVEFNYGRPLAVFSEDDGTRRAETNDAKANASNIVTLDKVYEYATILVKSDAGTPQVRITVPPGRDDNGNPYYTDQNGNPIKYDFSSTEAASEQAVISFNSDAAKHSTIGILKFAVPGDYKIDVLNPSDVGNYTVEVTVPNQPPQFEITAAQIISQSDTQDVVEVRYNLTDEDSADPFVTFRLNDKEGVNAEEKEKLAKTALYVFPENVSATDFENAKIFGKGTGKTARLVIDRSTLKAASYQLNGIAEDGTTQPVVKQATTLGNMILKMPGVPNPPTNIKSTVSASGVLLEWDARPSAENVGGYNILIKNTNNPDEWYEIWVNVENASATTIAKEIAGLKNGETYQIEIYSVNTENFEYSMASAPIAVEPIGMTVNGSPDLTVDMENTWVLRNDWNNDVTMTIEVKNIGTAASESAYLEVFYGKIGPEYAITTGMGMPIEPILPGGVWRKELPVSQELLTKLTASDRYAVNYPCIFRITNTMPKELNTANNMGTVEKIEEPDVQERTLTIHKGWNLVALPVNSIISASVDPDSDYTYKQLFGEDVTVLQYRDGKWLTYGPNISENDPLYLDYIYGSDGVWIYSSTEKIITIKGWAYQTDTDWISGGTWSLMGTGDAIDNPLAYFQDADPDVKAIWVFSNGQWVKNPIRIEAGQGFWVSRSEMEHPPNRIGTAASSALEGILLLLK